MKDNLNFTVKDTFLTDLQLEKLARTLEQFDMHVYYKKIDEDFVLDISWDPSKVYRKSSRYAGRHKQATDIDWNQVEYLKSIGMTNEEISEHIGVNLRTFYRRKNDHKGIPRPSSVPERNEEDSCIQETMNL